MTEHGLADAMRAAASPGSALFEETNVPIVGALGRLLAAAEQAGFVPAGRGCQLPCLLYVQVDGLLPVVGG